MSDLSPEEQAAHHERIRRTLERADEVSAETDAWLAERRADGTEFDERYAERQRQGTARAATPQPVPVPPIARAPARDWKAEERWVSRIAGKKVEAHVDPLAKEIGAVCGRLERRLAEQEKRAEADAAATVDLLLQIERRLAELEGRVVMKPPPKPKLVGSDGAA